MKYQNNSTNINGMQISYVSNTSIQVSAGNCYDISNALFIEFTDDIVIDATKVGANGLDVGSLEASKWYYVHAIYDQTAGVGMSALLSLSETAPALPKGFASSRMTGRAVRTNSSAQILKFYRRGALNLRKHYWDISRQVLTGGADTTFTEVDCSASIPPVETVAYLSLALTPDSAEDQLELAVTGSTTTYGGILSGVVADKMQCAFTAEVPITLVSDVTSFQYKVTSADDLANIYVMGYDDPL